MRLRLPRTACRRTPPVHRTSGGPGVTYPRSSWRKDFWVCWLLGILFESEFAGSLGIQRRHLAVEGVRRDRAVLRKTSTSRCPPAFLSLPEAGTSRNQASKWMTRAEAALRHRRAKT